MQQSGTHRSRHQSGAGLPAYTQLPPTYNAVCHRACIWGHLTVQSASNVLHTKHHSVHSVQLLRLPLRFTKTSERLIVIISVVDYSLSDDTPWCTACWTMSQNSDTGSTRRVQKVTAATSVAVSASATAAVAQQTGCFPCCYSGGEFQPTQSDPADASVPVDTTIYNDFTGQDHHQNCWSATPSR